MLLEDSKTIFFLAIPNRTEFEWNTNRFLENNLGITFSTEQNGYIAHQIQMHPVRKASPLARPEQRLHYEAENRLDSILHELIHAFLHAYTCEIRVAHKDNMQKILARGIEEECPRLFGWEPNLGRLDSMKLDKKNEEHGWHNTSFHDLEMYTFFERIGKAGKCVDETVVVHVYCIRDYLNYGFV
jgi:hypothetical protein